MKCNGKHKTMSHMKMDTNKNTDGELLAKRRVSVTIEGPEAQISDPEVKRNHTIDENLAESQASSWSTANSSFLRHIKKIIGFIPSDSSDSGSVTTDPELMEECEKSIRICKLVNRKDTEQSLVHSSKDPRKERT